MARCPAPTPIRSMSHAPGSPTREAWRQATTRRFLRLLRLIGTILFCTETLALTGWVSHLTPISFEDITSNILFAIGFGCPLVLHLSSLPKRTDLLKIIVAGSVATLSLHTIHTWCGVSAQYTPHEVFAAESIIGLGLASLGILIVQAWRSP